MINKSGIYKITSIKTLNFYIGSACFLRKRKNQHISLLKKHLHHNVLLQGIFDQYGESNLLFEIIELCDKNQLLIREQFYLDTLQPTLNICKKAGSSIGTKRSFETRKKMSLKRKNCIQKWCRTHDKDTISDIRTSITNKYKKGELNISGKNNGMFNKIPWNKGIKQKEHKIKVIQKTLTGEKINEFNSVKEASIKCKVSTGGIYSVFNNELKSSYGFIWEKIIIWPTI